MIGTGYPKFYQSLEESLLPDPDMPVDLWSDEYMVIPKSSGSSEYGPYRTSRTPYAREVMRALSDNHPCKRVVCMISSQQFKTQVAINWLASTIHQSPSNFLWLMPTGQLQKRIAGRIDKTIAAVDILRERVARPNSRSAKNNLDIKEFLGGSLFIATAGSAANLSELPARRVAIDEVDRCEANVNSEGDPIKLAESRQTTFKHNRKSYYYSSPTIEGESRIAELFEIGTKRRALAECIHCGHAQELVFEKLLEGRGSYPCIECGGLHVETDKTAMFSKGMWTDPVHGTDPETESFATNSLYLPYGWLSWEDLLKEYDTAKASLDAGTDEMMIVFYNTRLARTWKRAVESVSFDALRERAEDIKLRQAPMEVLRITSGVDTQDNRLAVQIVGWGRNLRCIPLDYVEFYGDPAEDFVWDQLTEYINTPISHESGSLMPILATAIDIGGHRGEAVKNYVRSKRIKCPIAIHGAIKVSAQPLAKGSLQDVNWKGAIDKKGVMIHGVGTVEIKHVLFARLRSDADKQPKERMIRFSDQFDDGYFAGIVSESYDRKSRRYVNRPGARNEPLDTLVYAYAALHHSTIRANRYTQKDWDRLESLICGGGGGITQVAAAKVVETEPKQADNAVIRSSSPLSRGRGMMSALKERRDGRYR